MSHNKPKGGAEKRRLKRNSELIIAGNNSKQKKLSFFNIMTQQSKVSKVESKVCTIYCYLIYCLIKLVSYKIFWFNHLKVEWK